MTIFVVIAHKGADALGAKVREIYPDHYVLPPSTWFVVDTAPVDQVRDKLGLPHGQIGAQGVVVQSGGVSGYAPSDLWEWLKVKIEAKS